MDLRATTDECLILRGRDYQEADRLLVVLGRRLGKTTCLARGVRRANSRLKAATQPFGYSQLEFAAPSGRSGLRLITQGQSLNSLPALRENLERIGCASYVGELLGLAIPENKPQENIFILAVAVLTLLAGAETPEQQFLTLKFFELRLLAELGWRPDFANCRRCGQRLTERAAAWSVLPHTGGLVCPACREKFGAGGRAEAKISPGGVRIWHSLLNWEPRALFKLQVSAELRQEVNQAAWAFLDYHLGKAAAKARQNLLLYWDI